MRQLAAEYAARGAREERTNEMTAAAVAHPVGMEVVTARCRNGAEWKRQKGINRRAKEVIRARQKKADEDAVAKAAHTEDVVRQSAAGATGQKRKRQTEKNKRQRKNRQVKKMHKEWEEELKKKAEEDSEAAQAMEKATTWRLRRQQTQAVRALRAVRYRWIGVATKRFFS